jgi:hypothetical protein
MSAFDQKNTDVGSLRTKKRNILPEVENASKIANCGAQKKAPAGGLGGLGLGLLIFETQRVP